MTQDIILNDLAAYDAQNEEVSIGFLQSDEAKEKKNPLVIYHGNCADGFTAAWVFWDFAREQNKREHAMFDAEPDDNDIVFDFHAGVYNDPPPDVTGRVVYLVDFSYSRAVVEEMLTKAEKVILIDHHKTAIDALVHSTGSGTTMPLGPRFYSYTDLERSGAMLAWDYLYNSFRYPDGRPNPTPGHPDYVAPPILLEHVQDRDLWKFKLEGSKPIHLAMSSRNWTFEEFDKMMKADETVKLHSEGLGIERKHFKDLAGLADMCTRLMVIGGYEVAAANMPGWMASDGGNMLIKRHPDTPFAATYYDTATQRVFSLRSEDSRMDVSIIAKLYGRGGGHRNAAGFRVPRDHELARC